MWPLCWEAQVLLPVASLRPSLRPMHNKMHVFWQAQQLLTWDVSTLVQKGKLHSLIMRINKGTSNFVQISGTALELVLLTKQSENKVY